MTHSRSSSKARLKWKRRAKVTMTDVSRRRTWESLCGRYRVVHSRCLFGPRKGPQAIPDRWDAIRLTDGRRWDGISRHRKKESAIRACERHFGTQEGDVPAPCLFCSTLSLRELCVCRQPTRQRPRRSVARRKRVAETRAIDRVQAGQLLLFTLTEGEPAKRSPR